MRNKNTKRATIFTVNDLYTVIDEQGLQRCMPVSQPEAIKLANSMKLKLVSENSPAHQDFINKFKGPTV